MNRVVLMGRLTNDPDKRYTAGSEPLAVTRYTLAVDRRGGKEKETDFINVVTFGKTAEFVSDYFFKGLRVCISGRIQTGSYTNREGRKVYTFEVVAENQEFAQDKEKTTKDVVTKDKQEKTEDGFMDIPEGDLPELPFN